LIDMRNMPDPYSRPPLVFNWIGHMEDHNGQFHVAWPQEHKQGNIFLINI